MAMSISPKDKEDDRVPAVDDLKETIDKLEKALNLLKEEDFVEHEDISFLKNLFGNVGFMKLCEINDKVANSQSFDQPEGSASDAIHDMRAHTPCSDEMEAELMTLVQKPHMEV
jgi:hypothetical protein